MKRFKYTVKYMRFTSFDWGFFFTRDITRTIVVEGVRDRPNRESIERYIELCYGPHIIDKEIIEIDRD